MSIIGAPEWFFAARKRFPIQLVNQTSRGPSGSSITFSGLPYGAYPTQRRLCIVGASSQDGGNFSNLAHQTLTWGGVPFDRRIANAWLEGGSSVTVSIWSKFVSAGQSGDLVITHNKSNCDSMGIATLVTTLCDSEAPVDAEFGTDASFRQHRISNLATTNGGFVLGLANLAFIGGLWLSLVGNGGVGAVPQLFQAGIEGEHKMAMWLKTGTPSGQNEDFEMTHNEPQSFWAGVMASWAGGI